MERGSTKVRGSECIRAICQRVMLLLALEMPVGE